jgi:hypothetical protein
MSSANHLGARGRHNPRGGAPGPELDAECVAHLSGSGRVLTRGGYVRLADAGDSAVVWTGAEWATARILPTTHQRTKYRVGLSNGQHVSCGALQTWVLNEGQHLVIRPTTDLVSGDLLYPTVLPDPCEAPDGNAGTGHADGARAEDLSAAKQLAAIDAQFKHDRAHVIAFLSGWISAQGGHLMAKDIKCASSLDLLLKQVRLGTCRIVDSELFISAVHQDALSVPPSSACFAGAPSRGVKIRSIEKTRHRTRMYHVQFEKPASARTILVGTCLMQVPNVSPDTSLVTSPPSPASRSMNDISGSGSQLSSHTSSRWSSQRGSPVSSACATPRSSQIASPHASNRASPMVAAKFRQAIQSRTASRSSKSTPTGSDGGSGGSGSSTMSSAGSSPMARVVAISIEA